MLVSTASVERLRHDADQHELLLRGIIRERLAVSPVPPHDDAIVATYYLALRTTRLSDAAAEIVYHASSGVHTPPSNSLLESCTAQVVGVDAFDLTESIGILHIAFPLKMLLSSTGDVTSCDILHICAGAVIFDIYEHQDARLIGLQIPAHVLQTFPGPAWGSSGFRQRVGITSDEAAFGTILKPTAGITPDDVERLVTQIAACPLFTFVKEDENLLPRLDYSPVGERVRKAVAAIERASDRRDGRALLYAAHVTGPPHEITETVQAAIEAGASGVMFSESFAGGSVRMVREATRHLEQPPAIYGHNAGIGVKTKSIWREVIDFLARLDGIDFRQTAPVRPGPPFLRPYGDEWEASEATLVSSVPGIAPTMIVRAGALDQGNIGLNLADIEARGIVPDVLFLAGSAINSIKNNRGEPDPGLGAEAMLQAIDVHRSGELAGTLPEDYVRDLFAVAEHRRLAPLRTALHQRYAGVPS